MINNKDIAAKLGSLMQLDFDAARAYEEAVEKIDPSDGDVKINLTLFLNDHKRHVSDLSSMIRALGEVPPQVSRDVKGVAIEGMTSLMSSMGTTAALKAMQQNERLTNKSYAGAVNSAGFPGYPDDVQKLLTINYKDEQNHLAYIESALKAPAQAR